MFLNMKPMKTFGKCWYVYTKIDFNHLITYALFSNSNFTLLITKLLYSLVLRETRECNYELLSYVHNNDKKYPYLLKKNYFTKSLEIFLKRILNIINSGVLLISSYKVMIIIFVPRNIISHLNNISLF